MKVLECEKELESKTLEKFKVEFKKYQVKTLSQVEKVYFDNLQSLQKKIDKRRNSGSCGISIKTKRMLTLEKVEDNDMQQIEIWLHKEYILKWYHDPEDWLREIRERNGSFGFLNHFIVLKDHKPIGFCQYYDCFDAQEEWYSINESNKIFSIDYLIGEEEYLGKGYGKAIVKLLIGKIQEHNLDAEIIVQPEKENIASCRALLSNGFVYNEEKEYFKLAR